MKKYLLAAVISGISVIAQANTIEKDSVMAETTQTLLNTSNPSRVMQNPAFPRGENALQQFLTSLISEEEYKFYGQKAKLVFSIDPMGLVYNVQITECDSELLKERLKLFFTQMPHWEPATLNGLPISSRVVLPISIQE